MYQIYVPRGQRGPTLLQDLGIAELVDGGPGPFFTEILANGPDGKGGVLLEFVHSARGDFSGRDWKPCAPDPDTGLPAGRFWWGLPKTGLQPSALARKNQKAGPDLQLGDGQTWRLPNMLLLPHAFVLDETTGDEATEVRPDWKYLHDRMAWAFGMLKSMLENGGMATDSDAKICRVYLAQVLAVNYRINLELVRRLKLFTDENWFTAAAWTVDRLSLYQAEQDLQKKKHSLNLAWLTACRWMRGLMPPDYQPTIRDVWATQLTTDN